MNMTSNGFLADIRSCARALIVQDRTVLVQVKSKPGRGEYLTLPGGRQDPGETLTDCLIRECEEEIGATVIVERLLHVAETFRDKPRGRRHQLDVLFACSVPGGYVPRLGHRPDRSQIATAWVPLDQALVRLTPAYGPGLARAGGPVYLGLCNG